MDLMHVLAASGFLAMFASAAGLLSTWVTTETLEGDY